MAAGARASPVALGAVVEVGREALTELRRLLGVLRSDDFDPTRMPRPSLQRIEELVGQVQAAGLAVELRVAGRPRPLPPGVDLSAYRIVQEALTNALRHAGRTTARVLVHYGDDELCLEVSDDGAVRPERDGSPPTVGVPTQTAALVVPRRAAAPGPAQGHGLEGMRERVAVFGGELAAGPRPEGGFTVRATHAGPGRGRGHAPAGRPRRGRPDAGADPHHLRPRRVRVRRAAGGGQRLPAQGHPAGAAGRGHPGGGGR